MVFWRGKDSHILRGIAPKLVRERQKQRQSDLNEDLQKGRCKYSAEGNVREEGNRCLRPGEKQPERMRGNNAWK